MGGGEPRKATTRRAGNQATRQQRAERADGRADRWLVVLRHAKSAWPDVPDTQRPLGRRGQRDAPRAGSWLREHQRVPDHVLCSPARRARETWELASAELAVPPTVSYDSRIYAADAAALRESIARCPPGVRTLLLVGHLPGVRDLTLHLAGDGSDQDALWRVHEKFPTSAIAVLAIPTGWAALATKTGRLTDFAVPRG